MPSPDALAHVIDVHCHPTSSDIPRTAMESLPIKICAMATMQSDQALVRELALSWPDKVIPCFGYHPWFSHQISLQPIVSKEQHYRQLLLDTSPSRTDAATNEAFEQLLPHLPQPVLLSDVLDALRSDLTDFPHAMLGEVGLDRAFKIPLPLPPPDSGGAGGGGQQRRTLSYFAVPIEHQLHIIESQLRIAVDLRRNVSMHSVQASQTTLQLFDRMSAEHGDAWDMISVDIHSCGFSPQVWTHLEKRHPNVYLSLSMNINARSHSFRELIATCSPHRILAESDTHDVCHSAELTWEMYRIIAEVKGWRVEKEDDHWSPAGKEDEMGVIQRLEENWFTFSRGNHVEKRKLDAKKRNKKQRDADVFYEMEDSGDE